MRRILFSRAALCGAVCALVACCLFAAADADAQAPGDCTKTLAAGGDLSTFLGTLRDGDVGCLREGEYTDGCSVSWGLDAATRATLRSYPGERATLHTSLGLAGDNLTAHGLYVTGIASSCGGDMSGFTVQGANDEILFSEVFDVTRHGILTNTSSSNVTVHGNLIRSVGSDCNLDHGVYFQTSGRITRNVFSDTRCGYGIHLYQHPHDVVVAENTSVGSRVRAGILIRTDGDNVRVVNNVFADNATTGINFYSCGSGCVVDRNITWGNGDGSTDDDAEGAGTPTDTRHVDPKFTDASFHVSPTSPAVDTGRADFAFEPDRDGSSLSGAPDLGAFELQAAEPAPTPEPSPTPSPTPEPTPDAYAPACAPTCDEQITDLRTENTRLEGDLATMTASRDDWRARALKAEDQVARILAVAQE